MKSAYFAISVLLIASGAVGLSVSDNVDQVPPPPRPTKKDDGSADLKPPPPPPPPQPANNNRLPGSSVVAEASVYDPSIYPGLLPSGIPGYPDPFPAAYPPQPYPPLGYVHPSGYPTPYVVQTGYEGYLVPAPQPVQTVDDTTDPLAFMRGLLPRSMINWISRSMAVLVGGMAIVFMGGAITTALCSLTPFCSISFKSLSLFNWNETARDVGKMLGKEITPERVRRTANLVRTAIRKYSELQKAFGDEPDTYIQ